MSKREWQIFVGLVLLATVIVSRGSHAMQGDAPYYLAVSHSIAHDFDLDLRNQYRPNGDYLFQESVGGELARFGSEGRLYPSNGIGFSAAMVPVFLAAETLATLIPQSVLESARWNRERCARDLISFVLSLLFAWVAILTLRVAKVVCGRDTGIDVPVVLAFVTPPMLFMSILAFTEVPAAFLCIWFLIEQMRPTRRMWITVLPLALLPWLHMRYIVVSVAGLVWVLNGYGRRDRGLRPVTSALVLPLASLALLAGSTWWMFGTVVPQRPPDGIWGMSAFWLSGVPGLLLDRDFGLLWVAPFWALALVGVPRLRRSRPDHVRFGVRVFLGTWLLAGLFEGPRGFGPPGRALVPVLPALVPLWSEGFSILSENRWRWLMYASVGWALWVSVALVERPARMWAESGAGIARIPLAAVEQASRIYSAAGRLERMGIDLDEKTFVNSVRDGNLRVVELFLKAGFAPEPGLVAAVQGGHAGVLELLLSKSARPGLDAGRALAWAKTRGSETLTRMLTSAGADLDSKDATGETALIASVRHRRAEELGLLIRSGADVNATTTTGQTALTVAIAKGNRTAVRQLIAAGANVNSRDADGWTPIIAAARKADLAVVRALIGAGADVNATSRLGWTALMWAAYDGQLEIVDDLLAAGADMNVASKAGQTALIRAAEQGHLDIVRTLIRAGADPRTRVDGADASAWADRNGHAAVAALLERAARSR